MNESRIAMLEEEINELKNVVSNQSQDPFELEDFDVEAGREIDGSIDNAAGVDLSNVTAINLDVLHLGNLVSKTQALNASSCYYVEVNKVATSGTVADAVTLNEATSFPAPSADKPVWKILETDANKRAIIYRGLWTEYDGTNIDVRSTQIGVPDVPIGTKWFWNSTTPPIGWNIVEGSETYPAIALYNSTAGNLLNSYPGTIGSREAYMDHYHIFGDEVLSSLAAGTDEPLIACYTGYWTGGLVYTGGVQDWTNESPQVPHPDETDNSSLDITPAATIHVMIERVAV